jgi:hypothetical protein
MFAHRLSVPRVSLRRASVPLRVRLLLARALLVPLRALAPAARAAVFFVSPPIVVHAYWAGLQYSGAARYTRIRRHWAVPTVVCNGPTDGERTQDYGTVHMCLRRVSMPRLGRSAVRTLSAFVRHERPSTVPS